MAIALPVRRRRTMRLKAKKPKAPRLVSSQSALARIKDEREEAVGLFAFQLKAAKISYRQEWEFAREELGRGWRWDFDFRPWLLAVEINGGIWRKGGGAHSRPSQILRDFEKGNAAAFLGWRTLAFTPKQVRDGTALAFTEKCLQRMKYLFANGDR